MSTVPPPRRTRTGNGYPTSDGKPMAETDWHRDLMGDLIETLQVFYADKPNVYVSGNLLLFYEKGNKRRHVSPDVFVVKGVAKHRRENYLTWEEGQPPHVAIELTSSSTRSEDTKKKYALYQDTLKVREYFLFDPKGDYLKPSMQGYRLKKGKYAPMSLVNGRMPSQVLGLHLERAGIFMRLWNPDTGLWLPTPLEMAEQQAERAEKAERDLEKALRELEELRKAK